MISVTMFTLQYKYFVDVLAGYKDSRRFGVEMPCQRGADRNPKQVYSVWQQCKYQPYVFSGNKLGCLFAVLVEYLESPVLCTNVFFSL